MSLYSVSTVIKNKCFTTGLAASAGGSSGGNGVGGGSTPHIFSHQGGLLQAAPFAPAWPHRQWPPEPSRTGHSFLLPP